MPSRLFLVILASCLAVVVAVALSASALGGSLLIPPAVQWGGRTTPSNLAKTTQQPITLTMQGTISPREGERPPPLKSLSLHFDRNGTIFTKGLATCRIPFSPDINVVESCQKALIGHGEVEFEVQPLEEPAFRTANPMLIYNGLPQGGRPVLVFHVYAHLPAPTTLISSGVVEKSPGKFGTQTQTTIPVPTLVGGEASLVGFRAWIGKTWTYEGRKVSLLTARCPRGSLLAYSEFNFVGGARIESKQVKRCS